MGKGDRIRERNARERIAFQQAAARKAEARRRAFLAFGSILAVLAVVVVLIVVKNLQKPAKAAADVASAQQTVQQKITSVPAAAFNTVGKGTASPLVPTKGKLPVLMSGGKPEILYVGAEYCPYCAAERWAMTAALSRFGTFSGLHFIHSSSTDVYPSTPTLTFYKSTYTSKYLTFVPVETTTVTKATLQIPTAAQNDLMKTYDSPGYFPFMDIGNKYTNAANGSQFVPTVLGSVENEDPSHTGMTWLQIAQDLDNPSSLAGQSILGTANDLTAAICKMTNGQPGSVCNSPAVKSIKQI